MPAKTKHIEIVAGPNGSGKTTFATAYLKLRNGKSRFINPDIIAAGLSAENTEQATFYAGRVMLTAVEEALDNGESFAFESTLSGKTWLQILKKAKNNGYAITIYFVFLKNARMNLRRIEQRVKLGGHSVPKATVFRRYPRSFANFWNLYRPLCDNWFVFDNSGQKPIQIQSMQQYEILSDESKNIFGDRFISPGRVK